MSREADERNERHAPEEREPEAKKRGIMVFKKQDG